MSLGCSSFNVVLCNLQNRHMLIDKLLCLLNNLLTRRTPTILRAGNLWVQATMLMVLCAVGRTTSCMMLPRSRTTYRLGAQLNVDEVVVETSPTTLADYPLLEKPLEEPKPVRVTHLPFDVDSSALTVSSLIEAVERIWLANLQRVFVR